MILNLTGVLADGSVPASGLDSLAPYSQEISWPRGEDGTLKLTVVRQDGTPANITGGTVVMAVRRWHYDPVPTISRQATLTAPASGLAEVLLVQADTIALFDEVAYAFDVQYTDAAGKRWQLIPESVFAIAPIYARPSEPVTVPPESAPLAQGPAVHKYHLEDEWYINSSATEELVIELPEDLATIPNANLKVTLAGFLKVSGGATGTFRVRVGGTLGAVDGAISAVLATTSPSSERGSANAEIANPGGQPLLKLTAQLSDAAQEASIRGAVITIQGV